MKLNEKLFANMRAATKALMGQGPKAATSVIHEALKVLTPHKAAAARQAAAPSAARDAAPAMRDLNPAPAHAGTSARESVVPPVPPTQAQAQPQAEAAQPQAAAAPTQEQYVKNAVQEATAAFNKLMPDLLAKLDRAGANGHAAFKMPHFDLPGMHGGGSATAADALPGKFTDGSFTNAAGTRTYKLYEPSTSTGQPMPLVVMLHGCTQDPDDFATGTQMNALAEEMQCLVVYPAQSVQANSSRCWNWFNAVDQQHGQGEPSIIAGITETVMHNHAVDERQVYVAGLSAGGAMATIMGTLYPELYAAVGVHSGLPFASAHDLPSALAAMKGNFGPQKASGKSIPIIVFHGDKDTTVHPVNGDELIKRGAHQESKGFVTEPGRVPDGHAYTRTVHQRADGTPQAEQWLIHGAGHAWSGGSARGSYTDGKGPDASREMMRFFQTKR
ncbi:extracellular catalytic domain type 1 short-chain-length polyhydroxyalkanoate depolymerase [Massilia antarctica]|uniref:extracellular catalytic domain type 1 short-chain-length polyhydroxyalkanoate depolymerase n=1 Tax=Massilia antarctica TaxID=2765360 RepID=UPI0006BC655F|nr:PHB depolymerase family esterase [Massilia sp. H27-R4]MCY0912113.1 PHB depolymerase family esterase [Massilia sp. H27-R4]CUI06415.1 Poly(3-hydroxybutyrate) depolymerase [Janthinobacterium sp. CG23_2]CUU30201.1 Poly(3-hydroxybutyrate) depolymerase [Janthinobacterium sp. CG23_2]